MKPQDKSLWQRHEADVANWLGGWITVGSGALVEKLDVQTDDPNWKMMVECKSTERKSFSVTSKLWNLIRERALAKYPDARPVLCVRIYGEGTRIANTDIAADLAVMSVHDLAELLNENREMRETLAEIDSVGVEYGA